MQMAKSKFTEVELEQIRGIQERLGCSRKTAVKKFKQSQAATKADVKKAAANDKSEASLASTMMPVERGKARAEGLRLYKLAGRPTKKDFIAVFGPKGVAWTWEARAKAVGLASAVEVASKFPSLLKQAAR
jgi:hypothetical protein